VCGADLEAIDPGALGREQLLEPRVDAGEAVLGQPAASERGLVGHHDEPETEASQLTQRHGRTGDQAELIGLEDVVDLLVDRPVAIHEHEAPAHAVGLTRDGQPERARPRVEREPCELAAVRLERRAYPGLSLRPAVQEQEAAAAGAADLAAERPGAAGDLEELLDSRALGDVRVHELLVLVRVLEHRAERVEIARLDRVPHLVGRFVQVLHPDDGLLAALAVHPDLRLDQAEIRAHRARVAQEQIRAELGESVR
jgi:hypothetical protein